MCRFCHQHRHHHPLHDRCRLWSTKNNIDVMENAMLYHYHYPPLPYPHRKRLHIGKKRIRRRQVLQIANDVGKICPYWPNILFIQSDLSLQPRCFQLHASCFKVSRRNSHWIIRWWLVSAYESLTSTVYVFVTLHLSPSSGVNLPILHFPWRTSYSFSLMLSDCFFLLLSKNSNLMILLFGKRMSFPSMFILSI